MFIEIAVAGVNKLINLDHVKSIDPTGEITHTIFTMQSGETLQAEIRYSELIPMLRPIMTVYDITGENL